MLKRNFSLVLAACVAGTTLLSSVPFAAAGIDESLVFARCEESVNVRSTPGIEGEVIGVLNNKDSAMVLGHKDGWYEIQSGSLYGYASDAYFSIGAEAEQVAEEVAYNVAYVYPDELNIYAAPDESSEVIAVAVKDQELEVVLYEGDWMKVALSADKFGYVNAYNVGYKTYYPTGDSVTSDSNKEEDKEDKKEEKKSEEKKEAGKDEEKSGTEETSAVEENVQETEPARTEETAPSQENSQQSSGETWVEPQQETAQTEYQAPAYEEPAYQETEYQAPAYEEPAYQETEYQAPAQTEAYVEPSYETATEAPSYEEPAQTEGVYEAPENTSVYEEAPTYVEDSGSDSSQGSSGDSGAGQRIVDDAMQYLGNAYVYGGTSLETGADCSGFTQAIMADQGVTIPRTAADQSGAGTSVSLDEIQAGDLLFYSDDGTNISHVAIYAGDGQIVHSANEESGVIVSQYDYDTPVSAARYW